MGSGTAEAVGLAEGEAPGEEVGARELGPGAGRGAPVALHWSGTPGVLQARGREMARVRLIGNWIGTLPVTMRHIQSLLVLVRFLSELQQSAVGAVPLAVLLVRKFMQGLKLAIVAAVQGVPIWP